MARRSQRLSSGSKVTSSPSHKRAASNTEVRNVEAKRSKTKKATPIKSQYFNDPEIPAQTAHDDDDDEASSSDDKDASEFGEGDEESSVSDAEDDEDSDDESDEVPNSRKKSTPAKGKTSSTAIRPKDNELLRPGVKAGLGPGTQVVIKKPKARSAGKTPYQDATIHPNTLLFLKDLKQNNERQWLKSK